MVQLLGVPVAFQEDLGWVPGTPLDVHNHVTPVPEDLAPSSGFHGHCMYMVQRHMQSRHSHR